MSFAREGHVDVCEIFVGFLEKFTWLSLDRVPIPTLKQLVHASSRLSEQSVVRLPQLAWGLASSTKFMRCE